MLQQDRACFASWNAFLASSVDTMNLDFEETRECSGESKCAIVGKKAAVIVNHTKKTLHSHT